MKMGDFSGKIDVEKLISCTDDLVSVLKDKRDIINLTQCFEQRKTFQSSCNTEFNEVKTQLQDYQGKIDACKQKTEKAKLDVAVDKEMDLLQKELEVEIEKEQLLMEELSEIKDLECQRISFEEQKQTLMKVEQDEVKAQRKLSMYASVTNIIPNLDDNSKISGYIVDREKKVVEKFEFNPTNITAFDACQGIWTMINS